MKQSALLFGLNYGQTPDAKLNGCVNDVQNVAEFLKKKGFQDVQVYTDETTPKETTLEGLTRNLYNTAMRTWSETIDVLWIHYSGHGSYMTDETRDEVDGKDECLVPSDYQTAGLLTDDTISKLLSQINPKTNVILFMDCCHSGTIADLKYCWTSRLNKTIENAKASHKCRILMISGCRDDQTSADAFNVDGSYKYSGAMTSCLLKSFETNPKAIDDVFTLLQDLRYWLNLGHFQQVPQLCSSTDISQKCYLIPKSREIMEKKEVSDESKCSCGCF